MRYRVGSRQNQVLKRRSRKPSGIAEVLAMALRKNGLDNRMQKYHFVLRWKEIVGHEIAKKTRPERLRKDVLFVKVADSIWAQELSFRKSVILRQMQKHVPACKNLKDIVFQVSDDFDRVG